MKVADAGEEIASLQALAEPWLDLGSCRQPYYGLLTGRFPGGPYGFDAIVKPEAAVIAATPREVRAHLLGRAEDALDALAAAGWQPTQYPAMEFTGSITFCTATLDYVLVDPATQHGIMLKMRFEVVPLRLPADAASAAT